MTMAHRSPPGINEEGTTLDRYDSMAGKGTRGRAMLWHGNPILRPIHLCHIHTTIEGCNVTMASHTYYDYTRGKHVTISHDSEEYRVLSGGGESGGEVVNSGRIVSPHVNNVPVQPIQEAKEKEGLGYTASLIVVKAWIVLGISILIGMTPLFLLGLAGLVLSLCLFIVAIVMYVLAPIQAIMRRM
jgi:hypothetical protein